MLSGVEAQNVWLLQPAVPLQEVSWESLDEHALMGLEDYATFGGPGHEPRTIARTPIWIVIT